MRLSITRIDDAVDVTVDDDGKHPGWRAETGAGHGLTGLRERVRAHGGTLATSPTRQGFRLYASVPIGAEPIGEGA